MKKFYYIWNINWKDDIFSCLTQQIGKLKAHRFTRNTIRLDYSWDPKLFLGTRDFRFNYRFEYGSHFRHDYRLYFWPNCRPDYQNIDQTIGQTRDWTVEHIMDMAID